MKTVIAFPHFQFDSATVDLIITHSTNPGSLGTPYNVDSFSLKVGRVRREVQLLSARHMDANHPTNGSLWYRDFSFRLLPVSWRLTDARLDIQQAVVVVAHSLPTKASLDLDFSSKT